MRGSVSAVCLVTLEHLSQERHFAPAAHGERRPLMQTVGPDVEDATLSVGGQSAGLLGEKGDRIGFVHQAQLALGMLSSRWVEENAPFEQCAVKVRDERTDIARGIRGPRFSVAKSGHEVLVAGGKAAEVGLVDGVVRSGLGHFDVAMREDIGSK
jgi:hypothetical protein